MYIDWCRAVSKTKGPLDLSGAALLLGKGGKWMSTEISIGGGSVNDVRGCLRFAGSLDRHGFASLHLPSSLPNA